VLTIDTLTSCGFPHRSSVQLRNSYQLKIADYSLFLKVSFARFPLFALKSALLTGKEHQKSKSPFQIEKIVKSKIFLLSMIAFFGALNAGAQSRKVQSVPNDPADKPTVELTQSPEEIKKQNEVGYSESSPNPKRPFFPANKKKTEKTDAKKKSQSSPNVTPQISADEEAIKVETNLVSIPVAVLNRDGSFVTDIKQADFKIFENGVQQEVAYFGSTEKAFTVVLMLDVSRSTAYKIEEIQAAAASFVNQLKPQDRVIVIEFDTKVKVLTEPTNDRDKINQAIKRTGFGNGTALYEAVDLSLHKYLDKIEGRKAIVLFTDGVDNYSEKASYEGTVRDAEESQAVVFPIYYNTMPAGNADGTVNVEYARGRAYLNALADTTGGRVVYPSSKSDGLANAFQSIAEELRHQYSIGYYPTESGTPGERRQIKVRVNRPKLVIRARDSYIVGGN
jgi:Ca-activated chloride channel family protein